MLDLDPLYLFYACAAIAAAEVIARLLGNWGERNSYTETVDAWVERVRLRPSPELVERARQLFGIGPQLDLGLQFPAPRRRELRRLAARHGGQGPAGGRPRGPRAAAGRPLPPARGQEGCRRHGAVPRPAQLPRRRLRRRRPGAGSPRAAACSAPRAARRPAASRPRRSAAGRAGPPSARSRPRVRTVIACHLSRARVIHASWPAASSSSSSTDPSSPRSRSRRRR